MTDGVYVCGPEEMILGVKEGMIDKFIKVRHTQLRPLRETT